jgi:uncharacterized damage-inducible protein DinB
MFQQMFKYKQWADRRTLDAVAAMDANVQAASLAFARQQLNHMVRVEEMFKARMLGQAVPHDSTNTELVPSLDELDGRLNASNSWLLDHAAGLTPEARMQTLQFQFADGKPGMMTQEEILFHLVNHGSYHRGAIGHALDLGGAARPADTYTVYIHATEPGRREGRI